MMTRLPARKHVRAALAAAALLLAAPAAAPAHEIPASVVVQAFVKAEGQRLRLLVRVPLASMRDLDLPLYGEGYLDVTAALPLLADAARMWIADYLVVHEGATRLGAATVAATRISLPSDRSFTRYDEALEHVRGPPLAAAGDLPWEHALLDVLLEYPIASAQSDFSIEPALAHLGVRTTTVLRFITPDGAERVLQYAGNPGLVRLDPRWHQAALQFVKLGFLHILGGFDHLLFVLCLVIPFRRMRPLVLIVTSFTVAHSITLIAAGLGVAPNALWFPPLIETLIAASIVFMAFENIVGARIERRWLIAFGFGLVHGFGFSFLLSESLQFAGSHLATSLLAFNVGVELGQLFVLALLVPALHLLFTHVVKERIGTILLSALVAHSAWHWMTERGGELLQYPLARPAFDLALLAAAMRGLMLLLIAVASAWVIREFVARAEARARERSADWMGREA